MPHPIMFDDADPLLARVRTLALALPDVVEKISHGRPTFHCGKQFGMYGGSVKGGERHEHSLLIIPEPAEREALIGDERFYVPAYLGPYGWLGLHLGADTDWDEVGELLDASYRQVAPRSSIAELDAR